MKSKELRDVIAIIEAYGLTYVGHERNKHIKITVEYNGCRRKLIHPASCSDVRGRKNQITSIRHIAQELGAYTRSA